MSMAKIKAAVIQAATVLAVIYVARRVPGVGPVVDTAIRG